MCQPIPKICKLFLENIICFFMIGTVAALETTFSQILKIDHINYCFINVIIVHVIKSPWLTVCLTLQIHKTQFFIGKLCHFFMTANVLSIPSKHSFKNLKEIITNNSCKLLCVCVRQKSNSRVTCLIQMLIVF